MPRYLLIFPIGLRMDTIVLCYTLIVPTLALLLLPGRLVRTGAWLLSLYFAVLAAIFCFMEIATFPFMAEFDTRPDRLFIEHMVQVREVFGMILKGYAANLAAGIAGMALVGTGMFLLMQRLLYRTGSLRTHTKNPAAAYSGATALYRPSFGYRQPPGLHKHRGIF